MSAIRDDVVREALSWLGTPFHDHAGVKGVGCDCAHLILRVYAAVGLAEDFSPQYKPGWFQHRDEPLFLNALSENGARKIPHEKALPGDVLMYNFGRHAAHGAIVVDANTIVHAYKPVGHVCRGSRRELIDRLDSAWSMFDPTGDRE
jgi:NlpC/P60 family putative phage cell wall peptidase